MTDLHITLLSDVVVCCCLLQNFLSGLSPHQIQDLLDVFQGEEVVPHFDEDPEMEPLLSKPLKNDFNHGEEKRRETKLFLTRKRGLEDDYSENFIFALYFCFLKRT